MNDCIEHQGLADFGSSVQVTKGQRKACIKFVGALYGKNACRSLNILRGAKAKASTRPKDLPPTDNSSQQHLLRCCYQILICRNTLRPMQDIPPVTELGYMFDDSGNFLEHVLSTQPMGAPELLNDMLCFCKDVCNEDCPCFRNKLPCTSLCSCLGDSGDTDSGTYLLTGVRITQSRQYPR